jgi:hypothetical protein
MMSRRFPIGVCWIQGFYYLLTGLWPLVSIETFQAVSGPKTDHLPTGNEADHWLVNTVGLLITVDALVLLFAAWRGKLPVEIVLLAIAAPLALIAIDVVYVLREVIAPIYLADAVIELPFVIFWCVWLGSSARDRRRAS